jgi:uncharacterized protein YqjF (DUF2071 family)
MHPALQTIEHRPWPLPRSKWTWRQSWLDLAFIHYRASAQSLQQRLPEGVQLETFNGSAWLGLVPFRMSGVMRRPLPDLPGFSEFPEINLRTYVSVDGRSGVWFFSLDAAPLPVVLGGKYVYGLPYHHAKIQLTQTDHAFQMHSNRKDVEFHASYRPQGDVYRAEPGTFEHWATERYCLYAAPKNGKLSRVDVHHAPWPIQRANVQITRNDILNAAQLTPCDPVPICHFSPGVQVVSYRPTYI